MINEDPLRTAKHNFAFASPNHGSPRARGSLPEPEDAAPDAERSSLMSGPKTSHADLHPPPLALSTPRDGSAERTTLLRQPLGGLLPGLPPVCTSNSELVAATDNLSHLAVLASTPYRSPQLQSSSYLTHTRQAVGVTTQTSNSSRMVDGISSIVATPSMHSPNRSGVVLSPDMLRIGEEWQNHTLEPQLREEFRRAQLQNLASGSTYEHRSDTVPADVHVSMHEGQPPVLILQNSSAVATALETTTEGAPPSMADQHASAPFTSSTGTPNAVAATAVNTAVCAAPTARHQSSNPIRGSSTGHRPRLGDGDVHRYSVGNSHGVGVVPRGLGLSAITPTYARLSFTCNRLREMRPDISPEWRVSDDTAGRPSRETSQPLLRGANHIGTSPRNCARGTRMATDDEASQQAQSQWRSDCCLPQSFPNATLSPYEETSLRALHLLDACRLHFETAFSPSVAGEHKEKNSTACADGAKRPEMTTNHQSVLDAAASDDARYAAVKAKASRLLYFNDLAHRAHLSQDLALKRAVYVALLKAGTTAETLTAQMIPRRQPPVITVTGGGVPTAMATHSDSEHSIFGASPLLHAHTAHFAEDDTVLPPAGNEAAPSTLGNVMNDGDRRRAGGSWAPEQVYGSAAFLQAVGNANSSTPAAVAARCEGSASNVRQLIGDADVQEPRAFTSEDSEAARALALLSAVRVLRRQTEDLTIQLLHACEEWGCWEDDMSRPHAAMDAMWSSEASSVSQGRAANASFTRDLFLYRRGNGGGVPTALSRSSIPRSADHSAAQRNATFVDALDRGLPSACHASSAAATAAFLDLYRTPYCSRIPPAPPMSWQLALYACYQAAVGKVAMLSDTTDAVHQDDDIRAGERLPQKLRELRRFRRARWRLLSEVAPRGAMPDYPPVTAADTVAAAPHPAECDVSVRPKQTRLHGRPTNPSLSPFSVIPLDAETQSHALRHDDAQVPSPRQLAKPTHLTLLERIRPDKEEKTQPLLAVDEGNSLDSPEWRRVSTAPGSVVAQGAPNAAVLETTAGTTQSNDRRPPAPSVTSPTTRNKGNPSPRGTHACTSSSPEDARNDTAMMPQSVSREMPEASAAVAAAARTHDSIPVEHHCPSTSSHNRDSTAASSLPALDASCSSSDGSTVINPNACAHSWRHVLREALGGSPSSDLMAASRSRRPPHQQQGQGSTPFPSSPRFVPQSLLDNPEACARAASYVRRQIVEAEKLQHRGTTREEPNAPKRLASSDQRGETAERLEMLHSSVDCLQQHAHGHYQRQPSVPHHQKALPPQPLPTPARGGVELSQTSEDAILSEAPIHQPMRQRTSAAPHVLQSKKKKSGLWRRLLCCV